MSQSSPAEEQARCARLATLAARVAGSRWLSRQCDGSPPLDQADYVAGDDYRNIDWNLCARQDELRVRNVGVTSDRAVYLLLDCTLSMAAADAAKFSAARDWARTLAAVALAGGNVRVGAAGLSKRIEAEFRPARGRQHAPALRKFFGELEPRAGSTDLQAAMRSFLGLRWPAGLAIVISDFLDSRGFRPALDLLRQAGFEPLPVHVTSPVDSGPRWQGSQELCDVESGVAVRMTVGPEELARYREAFARHCRALARYCARHRLGWIRLDSQAGPADALRKIMRPGVWPQRVRWRV
jgi:uncharacterized protein (DUF58 family)